ncbi:CBS domain-containing protein [Streptomyces sp. NPDC021224]|uniref:CBS domain-containing protein n=1 Tax=unclassified Streptomyces TaxID=2593676 RepID=UPI003798069A
MYNSPRTVGDVMTQKVVAVSPDATFKEIVATLEKWKVSALPVLQGDGRVVGVVSEADLLHKEQLRDSEPGRFGSVHALSDVSKADAVTAEHLMTSPAVCVHSGTTLAQAARIMAQRKVKRLPVTDAEDRLRGVVSRGDLLEVFLRPDSEIAAEVRKEVVHALFPDEAGPRVDVREGVVWLRGRVHDPGLIPVAGRLARTVEGVVDVHTDLTAEVTGL